MILNGMLVEVEIINLSWTCNMPAIIYARFIKIKVVNIILIILIDSGTSSGLKFGDRSFDITGAKNIPTITINDENSVIWVRKLET